MARDCWIPRQNRSNQYSITMNYTEEQLKAALVRALPNELIAIGKPTLCWVNEAWPYPIRKTEWPAIVGMVEDGLTDEQFAKYESARHLCIESKYGHDLTDIEFARIYNGQEFRKEALADIRAITIQ